MKTPFKLLASAGAAALLMASPGLQAESTYGYQTNLTVGVSATAKVNISVTVPKLILLRVGDSGADINTVTIALTPSSAGIPGGEASLTTGNSRGTDWNGTAAPVMTTSSVSPISLTAYAWTNTNGAILTGSVTTPFVATSGLTAADVLVTSSTGSNALAHPGTNTNSWSPTSLTPNVIASSTWTYSLSSTGLENARAGSHSQQITYTASAV